MFTSMSIYEDNHGIEMLLIGLHQGHNLLFINLQM